MLNKKIILILMIFISLFILNVNAASPAGSSTGYRAPASAKTYVKSTADSKERIIFNKCSSDLFIPTKISGEFNTFLSHKPCGTLEYTTSWHAGSYGSCSKRCNSGTKTRPITCRGSDGSTYPDSYCSYAGSKPSSSASCNTQSCCSTKTKSFPTTSSTSSTQWCPATGDQYISGNPYMSGTTAHVTVCTPQYYGSSCTVGGVTVPNGESRIFYRTLSSNNCLGNSQYRTCNGGTLSGSSSYQYSSCLDEGNEICPPGCEYDLGSHSCIDARSDFPRPCNSELRDEFDMRER